MLEAVLDEDLVRLVAGDAAANSGHYGWVTLQDTCLRVRADAQILEQGGRAATSSSRASSGSGPRSRPRHFLEEDGRARPEACEAGYPLHRDLAGCDQVLDFPSHRRLDASVQRLREAHHADADAVSSNVHRRFHGGVPPPTKIEY